MRRGSQSGPEGGVQMIESQFDSLARKKKSMCLQS